MAVRSKPAPQFGLETRKGFNGMTHMKTVAHTPHPNRHVSRPAISHNPPGLSLTPEAFGHHSVHTGFQFLLDFFHSVQCIQRKCDLAIYRPILDEGSCVTRCQAASGAPDSSRPVYFETSQSGSMPSSSASTACASCRPSASAIAISP